jgi:site-specific recombinase XerD
MVQYRVLRASRRAKLSQDGVHILRHTFCSHLARRGAPPRAIQERWTPGTGHDAADIT